MRGAHPAPAPREVGILIECEKMRWHWGVGLARREMVRRGGAGATEHARIVLIDEGLVGGVDGAAIEDLRRCGGRVRERGAGAGRGARQAGGGGGRGEWALTNRPAAGERKREGLGVG